MNIEKEKKAIQILQTFASDDPYYGCYSGGKDSDAIRILLGLSGVKYELHHNHTTVDAPETVYYVRSIPDVIISKPEKTMWQLIVDKCFPPTRLARYCCDHLKERGGKYRKKVTGVRWAESKKRADNSDIVKIIGKPAMVKKILEENGNVDFSINSYGGVVLNTDNAESREVVESCYRSTSTLINPIIDWTDQDVWDFLHHYGCKSNPLYECGYKRIGCIGCPLGGFASQKREFARYPQYKKLYMHAFDRMIKERERRGLPTVWKSGAECMAWWTGEDINQLTFNFEGDEAYIGTILDFERGIDV